MCTAGVKIARSLCQELLLLHSRHLQCSKTHPLILSRFALRPVAITKLYCICCRKTPKESGARLAAFRAEVGATTSVSAEPAQPGISAFSSNEASTGIHSAFGPVGTPVPSNSYFTDGIPSQATVSHAGNRQARRSQSREIVLPQGAAQGSRASQ